MQYMDRRTMLCAMALGVLFAIRRAPAAGGVRWKIPLGRVPAPAGVLTRLPGDGNQLALTVDDGASVPVVGAFAQFCADTGSRLTFFVNGANSSWSVNAPALRPMVDSGQVQMANHTWSHPYLNRLNLGTVADQISHTADLGYPTITMWSGDVGDSRPENENSLIGNAGKSFQPQQIVITHANLPTITHCYAQLLDIIHSRNLQTVTLNDVFG